MLRERSGERIAIFELEGLRNRDYVTVYRAARGSSNLNLLLLLAMRVALLEASIRAGSYGARVALLEASIRAGSYGAASIGH